MRRVTLKTDARNARSRANIERIGARFDGVLRAHMPAGDGGIRDSAFYSMLASGVAGGARALASAHGSVGEVVAVDGAPHLRRRTRPRPRR